MAFAADAYDDCIADLDEQLGKLVDELGRRGVLEQTWLIITSDHGESFGEHAGVFCHGTSLYETELHVPLLIIPPGAARPSRPSESRSVCGTWRRRSSTLTGQAAGSPFPGDSLARFWKQPCRRRQGSSHPSASPRWPRSSPTTRASAITGVCPSNSRRWEPSRTAEWSYIRREGDVREELFHLREDAERDAQPGRRSRRPDVLEQMRAALDRLTGALSCPSASVTDDRSRKHESTKTRRNQGPGLYRL